MDATDDESSHADRQKQQEDIERLKQVLQSEDDFSEDEDQDQDEITQNIVPLVARLGQYIGTEGDTEDSEAEDEAEVDLYSIQPEEDADGENVERKAVVTHSTASTSGLGDTSLDNLELLANISQTFGEDLPAYPGICLMLNRAYKEVISEILELVKLALVENRERQEMLKRQDQKKGLMKSQTTEEKRKLTSYATPYFRDINGSAAPDNADVKERKERFVQTGSTYKAWTMAEKRILEKAVKQDALQRKIRPLMNRKELLVEKIDNTVEAEDLNSIQEAMSQINEEIAQVKKMDLRNLIGGRNLSSEVDWLKIATQDLNGGHSPVSCQLMWQNMLHPDVNRCAWTPSEESLLLKLVEDHGLNKWQDIAAALETNRTAFQCLHRYQTKLNPASPGLWSKQEDETLKEIVEALQVGNHIPWGEVAANMEGRSVDQCTVRYNRICQPFKRFGRWELEEDLKLLAAVKVYGTFNWSRIQQNVPGRDAVQCRERYQNALDPKRYFGEWTYEDDRTIYLHVVANGPGQWAELAKLIPGRTDNQIMMRYRRLCAYEGSHYFMESLPPKLRDYAKKKCPFRVVDTQEVMNNLHTQMRVERAIQAAPVPRSIELNLDNVGSLSKEEKVVRSVINYKGGVNKLLDIQLKHILYSDKKQIERDEELRQEDLTNGLIIPHIPPSHKVKHKAAVRLILERKQMHLALHKQVEKRLQEQGRSDSSLLATLNQWALNGEAPGISEPVKETLESITQSTTIKKLQQIAEDLEKADRSGKLGKKSGKQRGPGRPQKNETEATIEKEIVEIMRRHHQKVRRGVGRPRKYTSYTTREGHPTEHERVPCAETSAKITQLLMMSLNMDFMGALARVETLKQDNYDARRVPDVRRNLKGTITPKSKVQDVWRGNPEDHLVELVPRSTTAAVSQPRGSPMGSPNQLAVDDHPYVRRSVDRIRQDPEHPREENPGLRSPDPVHASTSAPEPSSDISTVQSGSNESNPAEAVAYPPAKKAKTKQKNLSAGFRGKQAELVDIQQEYIKNDVEVFNKCVPPTILEAFRKQQQERGNSLQQARRQLNHSQNVYALNNCYQDGRLVKPPLHFGKKAFMGKQAEAAYTMPPLPPSCVTVNAFKQLLLLRKKLVRDADKFYVPLEGPKRSQDTVVAPDGDDLDRLTEDLNDAQAFSVDNLQDEEMISQRLSNLPAKISVKEILSLKKVLMSGNSEKTQQLQELLNKTSTLEANQKPSEKAQAKMAYIRTTHDYQVLKSRFNAIFLWPGLMSTIPIPSELLPLPGIPVKGVRNSQTTASSGSTLPGRDNTSINRKSKLHWTKSRKRKASHLRVSGRSVTGCGEQAETGASQAKNPRLHVPENAAIPGPSASQAACHQKQRKPKPVLEPSRRSSRLSRKHNLETFVEAPILEHDEVDEDSKD